VITTAMASTRRTDFAVTFMQNMAHAQGVEARARNRVNTGAERLATGPSVIDLSTSPQLSSPRPVEERDPQPQSSPTQTLRATRGPNSFRAQSPHAEPTWEKLSKCQARYLAPEVRPAPTSTVLT